MAGWVTGSNMTRFPRLRLSLLTAAIVGGLAAFPADSSWAEDSFTPAQRQEIVAIVRNALKTDPTILADAITAMRAETEAQQQAKGLQAVRANRAKLAGSSGDIVLGNPKGSLSVVEFYDPRCPYCRKVLPDLDKLVAAEPDLRLVEKVVPVLGPASQMEAQAIAAAGLQGGYLKLQQALMSDSQPASIARIRALATAAGLDADRLERDMKGPDVAAILHENMDLARQIGLEGTPTFLIGEKAIIPGAASFEDLKSSVDSLRKPG
ncbi:DsbA family protein [Acetobacter sacchari]